MARTDVQPIASIKRARELRVRHSGELAQHNEILRRRMREALALAQKTATAVALDIGRDRNYFRDFLKENPKKHSLSPIDLAKFAVETNVTVEWLLGKTDSIVPNVAANARQPQTSGKLIPLYARPLAGENDAFSFTDGPAAEIACPPFLERVVGAYAVGVSGESMEPRYRAGEVLYVNPARPPRRGDDVVMQVQTADQQLAYIKNLLQLCPDQITLRQYNPQREISFRRDRIKSMHVIAGMIT